MTATLRPPWFDPDPDSATLEGLYVKQRRTEREIAQLLGISRAHVGAALAEAGIERRTVRRPCPVDARALAKAYSAPGATVASLSRRFGAAAATVERWLAEAGLLSPDPEIDHKRLRRLYLEKELSVAEVARKLGVTRARVQRELAVAGVEPRSNRHRPPRGNRAKLTDARLRRLYVTQRLGFVKIADKSGVSTEYVARRIRELGLVKRLGSFTPKGPVPADEVRRRAPALYESGLNMKEVGRELGLSVGSVRSALHEARVPVRRSGPRSHDEPARTLVDDLYADREIRRVLSRHQVVIPEEWAPAGPFESLAPLPLSAKLLTNLYDGLGLPIMHIALLLGVGIGAVRSGLLSAGVALRTPNEPAPWTTRRP